ncbi:MAG: PAS domain-containing protein [Bacteroidia bacterium]|nr:PAS domain-containing protein [Bacteroidia bacterium]
MENLPYPAWSKDQNGKFLSVNQNFAQLTNKKIEDIIGKTDTEVWGDDLARKNFLDDREVFKSGKQKIAKEIIRRGSEVKWIETLKTPLYDEKGRIIGTRGISRDITHLKESFRAETSEENRFKKYFHQAPTGLFSLDQEGKFDFVNSALCDLLDSNSDDLLDSHIQGFLADSHQANALLAYFRSAQVDESKSFELRCLTKYQRPVWILLDIVKTAQGSFLGSCRDISIFYEREDRWKLAKEQADRSNNLQAQFLSTVSHEIRTPMNAIIALTYLLLQENPKPEQIQSLNTLKFSAENLLVLINDILDYNKIEAGKLIFESIDYDLRHLIHSIKEGLNFKAREKGVPLLVRIAPEIPPVLIGDPVRLSQILTNLMDNAIKFTHEGYVSVDVELRKDDGQYITLYFAITDTGIGIEQDKLQPIFERFTQASADTTRKFGGTGLGLAITKKLLELQGSSIQVESEIGKGSRFYFEVKLKKSNQLFLNYPDTQRVYPSLQNLGGARILMVEDNEINQLVATQFLKKWNAEIDYAENGEIAIRMIEKMSMILSSWIWKCPYWMVIKLLSKFVAWAPKTNRFQSLPSPLMLCPTFGTESIRQV